MSPSTAWGSSQHSEKTMLLIEKTRPLPCERASPLTRWFLRQPSGLPVPVFIG